MDSHLSVDAGALDAGQDPQVGGQPLRIYGHERYENIRVDAPDNLQHMVADAGSVIEARGWT